MLISTMRKTKQPNLWQIALAIAAEELADPRTVLAALGGKHVRGRVGERIRRNIAARGITSTSTPTAGEVDLRLEARG